MKKIVGDEYMLVKKYSCYGYNSETNREELLLESDTQEEIIEKVKVLAEILSNNTRLYIVGEEKKETTVDRIKVYDKKGKEIC